jgi:cytochrome c553
MNVRLPIFLFATLGAVMPARSTPERQDALAVLEAHCVKCHGGEKTKAALDLVTREALLKGGESGAAVVPGKPDSGLLLKTIRHEEDPHMPQKAAKLADAEIAAIENWIKEGAPYARTLKAPAIGTARGTETFVITEKERSHWAFRSIQRPAPPDAGAENPIDRFILAKLKSRGLEFAPTASKEVIIRRVTLDLIGLPPTPREVDAFISDPSPDAYEKLIERLLASPHYGERWGRHWLDLARYAETDGFEHDAVRPHSWRYRDYVIRAFNEDRPYDRFIREQLAGDELWPEDPEARIATGFNLLGPDMVDSSDQVQRRHNTLNDMTDTTALVFLGLTMGCARCHDHKFEPLSQRDYYAMQAFFTPAKFDREHPVPSAEQRAAHEAAMRVFNENATIREIADLETPVRERIFQGKVAKLSPEAQTAHRTPPEKRDAEQANLALETAEQVAVSDKEIANALNAEERRRREALLKDAKKLAKPEPLPRAMTLASSEGAPRKTFILNRGEYTQPVDEVSAGYPTVVVWAPASAEQSTRAALANWIASPKNPLTARVMVNRIWQHHFGSGLVATPSEFGTHGQKPTHPELLDWLASEFIERGWSIKRMHRLMLTSTTYRQSSQAPASMADPNNQLYGRMNRLRLEGEVIRDSLLAISGQLNPVLSGPGVFPPVPVELFKGARGWTPNKDPRDYSRRSIYIFARRNLRFPFLEVFDAPDTNLSCPVRERSTTAPQSLTLLNADEVMTAARATADRLRREANSAQERIELAFRLILGRKPGNKERSLALDFIQTDNRSGDGDYSELCRALFNLNDFVYAE